MTVRTIHLSPEAIEKLDRIAAAPSIDGDLLREIGISPGEMLRFAEKTGEVPSPGEVRQLLRKIGPDPNLRALLVLAHRREMANTEVRGSGGRVLVQTVGLAAVVGGMMWTLLRRLRTRKRTQEPGSFASELSQGEDARPAIEGESASEA